MKDEQVEVLVDWFDELESKYSIHVKYIDCDNGGENKALQQPLKREGLKIHDMILLVISLYLLRSNNSMTIKTQQSNRKYSGASENSLTTTASTKIKPYSNN